MKNRNSPNSTQSTRTLQTSRCFPLNITDSTSIFPEFVKFHGIAWTVSELHQIHPNFSGLCKLSQNCMERLRPSSYSADILRNLQTFTELLGESPNFIKFNRNSPDSLKFLRIAWNVCELHQIQPKFFGHCKISQMCSGKFPNFTKFSRNPPDYVKFYGIAWDVSEIHRVQQKTGLCKLS